MIELKNVSKFYNDNKTVTVGLRNVSLKLNKGEFVAITGDSGSGKSTLLNVISSIDNYDDGEILFYGNETFYFNQNDSDAFRKNNVSFIFQKYNIVDSYTVLENVMLPLIIKGKTEAEAKTEALEIIRRVGLGDRALHKGSKLSGGEKQRCVIARALATDSPILACDEPTGNLDSQRSREIIELIKEVSEDKLVLVVTHDYDSIKDVCTRKIKMSDGEIVEDISFCEGVEEETCEMALDDSPPTKKTLFKLASLNILSTPKKTVFTSLVFTFVSCLFLLLTLLMIKVSYDENYTYNERYGIISSDRLVIYDTDHTTLDMAALDSALKDSEYYVNAFYEEIGASIKIGNTAYAYAALTFHDIDYELVTGSDSVAKGEFILIMPAYSYSTYYGDAVGESLELYSDIGDDYTSEIGKLVGIGISDDVNSMYLLADRSDTSLANAIMNESVTLSYNIDGVSGGDLGAWIYEKGLDKPYVAVPKEFEGRIDYTFNLKGLYNVSYDFDTVYTNTVTDPTLFVGQAFLNGEYTPVFEGAKEITVYTDNAKAVTRAADDLGYSVSIPSMIEDNDGISLIVLYMLSFVIIAALFIMFYISFAVLQRIYLTKMKDYSIFRTLGLVADDLKKVLFIEVTAITLVSILLGGLLSGLMIAVTRAELGKYLSPVVIILYVLIMSAFGILTAIRLNNKMFGNTVYQSLKEGGE